MQKKDLIKLDISIIDIESYKRIHLKVNELVFRNVTSKVISRLRNKPELNNWIYSGLGLHKTQSSLKCEFCGQSLPEDRIAVLEEHFNQEYKNIIMELKILREDLLKLLLPEILDFKLQLFDFLRPNFDLYFKNVFDCRNEINSYVESWIKLTDAKISNPFINEGSIRSDNSLLSRYNTAIEDLNKFIDIHNDHVKQYETISEKARIIIENHFVAQKAKNEDLRKIEGAFITAENEIARLENEMDSIENAITLLETSLKTDIIAINQINQALLDFIGKDIKLVRSDLGYELQRDGEIAKNISEGEKTALALVYFVAKLNEKANRLEETILVIDDPICSFDCNRLFHTNYFLRTECQNAKQLFILTHNFHFFTLLKEWAERNDEIEYYHIKSKVIDKLRNGTIENCDNAVKYFSSEYHCLFNEVYTFINGPDKEYLEIHVISNICRQLIESFLTFKFGRKKLEKCFDEITDFKDIDKVRKFINYYSHRANYGSSIEGFSDNLMTEVDSIVLLVFKLIEHVDKTHFDSMMKRIKNQ